VRIRAYVSRRRSPRAVKGPPWRANAHDTHNLPIFVAGGGFKHGQYIAHDQHHNTQLSNLFLTLLGNVGIETESFGESSAPRSGEQPVGSRLS
jgi:hypothetical protein